MKPKKRRFAGELNKIELKKKLKEEKEEKKAAEAKADQPFAQLLACLKESSRPSGETGKHNISNEDLSASEEENVEAEDDLSDDDDDDDDDAEAENVEEEVGGTDHLEAPIDDYLTPDEDSDADSDGEGDGKLTDNKQAFNNHINMKLDEKSLEEASRISTPSPGYSKSMGDFDVKKRLSELPNIDLNFPSSLSKLKIKTLLKAHAFDDMVDDEGGSSKKFRLECLSLLLQYVDFLYLKRSSSNAADLRKSYCLHVLNHLLNIRETILKNNNKLARLRLEKKPVEDLLFRDQGFTRARVLIVLPFRHSAKQVITCLATSLFGSNIKLSTVCRQWTRFIEEFSLSGEEPSFAKKPQDFVDTFQGNIDDSFRIGLAVTKKSLKLYTDFRSSDIIICSPLSLRMMIKNEKTNYDYLSSIEIFILDQTEVLLMQNWEHVIEIVKALNQIPKDSSGIDFSRVRLPLLDGNAQYYRQNIFLGSSYVNEIVSLFSKYSKNIAGQISFVNQVSSLEAPVTQVLVKCKQTFLQHKCKSIASCSDCRFEYFKEIILPQLHKEEHAMVFISSYFDFVRVRNFLKEQEINVVSLCEYTKQGKIAQARSLFFHGSRKVLLYTERFHFFHRFIMKGIQRIYFYQLPAQPQLYSQVCNFLTPSLQGKRFNGGDEMFKVECIFCRMDTHRVINILGNQLATKVLAKKQFNLKAS